MGKDDIDDPELHDELCRYGTAMALRISGDHPGQGPIKDKIDADDDKLKTCFEDGEYRCEELAAKEKNEVIAILQSALQRTMRRAEKAEAEATQLRQQLRSITCARQPAVLAPGMKGYCKPQYSSKDAKRNARIQRRQDRRTAAAVIPELHAQLDAPEQPLTPTPPRTPKSSSEPCPPIQVNREAATVDTMVQGHQIKALRHILAEEMVQDQRIKALRHVFDTNLVRFHTLPCSIPYTYADMAMQYKLWNGIAEFAGLHKILTGQSQSYDSPTQLTCLFLELAW